LVITGLEIQRKATGDSAEAVIGFLVSGVIRLEVIGGIVEDSSIDFAR
jgi:hypothetical protein